MKPNLQFFKRTAIDTHYGPFCWDKIVPCHLPKGTLFYGCIVPDVKRPGYALTSLENYN